MLAIEMLPDRCPTNNLNSLSFGDRLSQEVLFLGNRSQRMSNLTNVDNQSKKRKGRDRSTSNMCKRSSKGDVFSTLLMFVAFSMNLF